MHRSRHFLFEPKRAFGQLARVLQRKINTLGRYYSSDLFQAFLAHGFGKNGVGFTERINAVNQIDIEVTDVHGEFADAIYERGIPALQQFTIGIYQRFRFLRQI